MPPKRKQNRPKSKAIVKVSRVLPFKIIASIFARLPLKSLARFKCVCKPFKELFTDPDFIKLHSKTPKTSRNCSVKSHVIRCPILGIDPPKKLNLVNPTDPYEIYFDSCNGLICMGRPRFSEDVVLWNPATNIMKILPHSPFNFGAAVSTMLGFGCNEDGDDFKVVRIFILKGKNYKVGVEVYSSKADSWRKIKIDIGFKFLVMSPRNSVIVKGNPYWVVACLEKKLLDEGHPINLLMGFDSTNTTFRTVHMPDPGELGDYSGIAFVDWEGLIGALVCLKRVNGLLERIAVWLYDEGVSEWRRDTRSGPIGVDAEAEQILNCSKSGKIVGVCTDRKLFMYDPRKDTAGVVSKFKKRNGCTCQIFAYEESLAYVKGMRRVVVKKVDQKEKFKDMDGFFMCSLHDGSEAITCSYALGM